MKIVLVRLLPTLLMVGAMVGAILGVSEANNPMPTPDPNEVCQYNCGGPSFSLEGFVWAAGIVGIFLYFALKR